MFAGVYAIPRIGPLAPGALPIKGWGFVGWAVLSAFWAIKPGTSFRSLQTLIRLAIIGFLISDLVIHDPTVVRPLLWIYSAALFIDVFGYRKQVWVAIGLVCGLAYLAKQASRRREEAAADATPATQPGPARPAKACERGVVALRSSGRG